MVRTNDLNSNFEREIYIIFFIFKGQKENLKSPSSRLVTGRMVNTGTGTFDILTKLL